MPAWPLHQPLQEEGRGEESARSLTLWINPCRPTTPHLLEDPGGSAPHAPLSPRFTHHTAHCAADPPRVGPGLAEASS